MTLGLHLIQVSYYFTAHGGDVFHSELANSQVSHWCESASLILAYQVL